LLLTEKGFSQTQFVLTKLGLEDNIKMNLKETGYEGVTGFMGLMIGIGGGLLSTW
jgi:hypothetical protein